MTWWDCIGHDHKAIMPGEVDRDEADFSGVFQPRLVHVADHDDGRTQELRRCSCREAYGTGASDEPGLTLAEAVRQNVGHDLGQSLVLVSELEQVEVSVGNHDVTGLSADPTAHVDIAIGRRPDRD
jgi:hypothetical protein